MMTVAKKKQLELFKESCTQRHGELAIFFRVLEMWCSDSGAHVIINQCVLLSRQGIQHAMACLLRQEGQRNGSLAT